MTFDFDNPPSKPITPSKLAHVVLQTTKYKAMIDYYKAFLGAEATYENSFLSFLTYDDEHHRIAIAYKPHLKPRDENSSGLVHIAFTFDTLETLAMAYLQRKAKGILPYWCINHGPTTSLYYSDPDGNQLEMQTENFDTVEETNNYMTSSKDFLENPIGIDFHMEDLIKRLKSGEEEKNIKKRVGSGPRDLSDIPEPPAISA